MSRRYLALAAVAILPCGALARQIPTSGAKDNRMRTVIYDPAQVVRLSTVMGTALVVTFAADEKISAVAVTDSKNLAAMPRDNFLFLKSHDVLPSQPIIVLTKGSRGVRRYVFEFEAISAARQAAEQRDIYYSVEFRYPRDRVEEQLAAQRQQLRARRAKMTRAALEKASQPEAQSKPSMTTNWRYVAQGNRTLTPDIIYDNGYSTFFHFRGNTRVPAIFRINPDGREATVNSSVKNDWVVVGIVAPSWRLRDGKTSLNIWNRAYDVAGHSPKTGTVSGAVRRVAKDNPK